MSDKKAVFKAPSLPAPARAKRRYGLVLPEKPPELQQQEGSKDDAATPEQANVPPTSEAQHDRQDTSDTPTNIFVAPDGTHIPLLYEPPFWSAPPIHKYFLEIMKDGVVVETLPTHAKGHYLVGRLPFCDIQLEHPSISRQHAVIQFRKNGAAYLFDLESSHGSYVNKKPSKPKGYTKIMPGDQIKFGQSTRTFILGGGEPPQDDSEEYMEKKEAAEQKKKQAAEQNKKQRQVLDKLPTQKKMSAEEVADAIRRARDDDDDADDLAPQYDDTEGDDAELEKKRKAEEEFFQDYYGSDEDYDDDDYYDRTESNKKRSKRSAKKGGAKQQADNYDTLLAKTYTLRQIKRSLQAEVAYLEKASKQETADEQDELDSYMSSLAANSEEGRIKKKVNMIKDIEAEETRMAKLIEIVKPALTGLQTETRLSKAAEKMVDLFEESWRKKKRDTDGSSPPVNLSDYSSNSKAPSAKPSSTGSGTSKSSMAPPPPQPPRVQVPSSDRIAASAEPEPAAEEQPSTESMMDTSSVLIQEAIHNIDDEFAPASAPPKERPDATESGAAAVAKAKKKKRKRGPEQTFDSESNEYDTWIPPAGQTGDGTTSLNAKYGY